MVEPAAAEPGILVQFGKFAWEVGWGWAVLMGGPIFTAIGVHERRKGAEIAPVAFWALAAACVILSPFFAWKTQDDRASALEADLREARREKFILQEENVGLRTGGKHPDLDAMKEQLAEEHQRSAALERQLAQMRAAAGPRSLTDEQETGLSDALQRHGPPATLDIQTGLMCDDCTVLVGAFMRAFQSAGWSIGDVKDSGYTGTGIYLFSGDADDDGQAEAIRAIVRAATGLPCDYGRYPGSGPLRLVLLRHQR